MRVFNIFVNKKWTAIDGYDEVLNRFGNLLHIMKEEQAELLINLIERYHWMTYNDYHTSLRGLLKALLAESLDNKTKVYIFPIIKPSDESKTKSGHAVMYMLDSIKPSINGFRNIEFMKLESFEDVAQENLDLKDNEFLILVDDFIGTGNTLNSTLTKIDENPSIKSNYAILTVAIQDEAKELLENKNIKYFSNLFLSKGIKSHYQTPELEKMITIMEEIEKNIPKVKNYRFGYEKSEALVTLIRTPNNTFPVFWKGIHHKGKSYDAPFSRY